jgi:hypothetical protein
MCCDCPENVKDPTSHNQMALDAQLNGELSFKYSVFSINENIIFIILYQGLSLYFFLLLFFLYSRSLCNWPSSFAHKNIGIKLNVTVAAFVCIVAFVTVIW